MRSMLDPSDPITKKMIKGSIADGVLKDVVGSDRDDVERRVEAEYERMLSHAHVLTHIPSLTAGAVMRAERLLVRRRAADLGRAATRVVAG